MAVSFCVICASKMTLKDAQQLTCSKTHGEKLRVRRKRVELGEEIQSLHCRSCGNPMKYREDLTRPCAKCTFLAPATAVAAKTCNWCGNLNREAGDYCSVRCRELDEKQQTFLTEGSAFPLGSSPMTYGVANSLASPAPPAFAAPKPRPPRGGRYVEASQKGNGTCLFCGVKLEEDTPEDQKYCSPSHARKAQRWRQQAAERRESILRDSFDPNLIGRCPFPDKRVYSSKEEAMRVIEETERWSLVPYLCNCLMWHVGNNPQGSRENYEAGYTGNKLRKQSKRLTEKSVERMRDDLHGPRKGY